MKPGRIFRDLLVLAVFCGCFYLLTLNTGEAKTEQDFSPARLRADEFVKDQDWDSASKEFESLVKDDPFNGRAWFMLGSCHYYIANDLLGDRHRFVDGGVSTSDPKITEMDARISVNTKKAIEIYQKSKEFARYRNNSLLRLAVMECRLENFDTALDYLREFVDFDGYTVAGLFKYREFGRGGQEMCLEDRVVTSETRLHDRQRFWDICVLEEMNR